MHTRGKLIEQQVIDIRSRYRRGLGTVLAAEYGISDAMVSGIVRGKKWPHAPGVIRPSFRSTSPGAARAWLVDLLASFDAGAYTDECVLWPFGLSQGYANIGSGRTKIVTRIIVEWLIDAPLAAEDFVCHICDVRQCVNPAHLFIGTNQDNMTDMVQKGRQASGSRIATARLSDADVLQIRAAGRNGAKAAEIAARFGVSPSHVSGILRGRYWTKTAAPLAVAA